MSTILDFGLSVEFEGDKKYYETYIITGSLAWMPLELLESYNERSRIKYTQEGDVYSLGIVFLEIIERKAPQYPPSFCYESNTLVFEELCPDFLKDLIRSCLSIDPSNRPTSQKILEIILNGEY